MAQAITQRRRYRAGKVECGYVTRQKPWWLHLIGVFIALVTFLFSYAALMESGLSHAVAAFSFGFFVLLLVHGHHLDVIYLHIGDRVKIGARSSGPPSEIPLEVEDDAEDGFERLE